MKLPGLVRLLAEDDERGESTIAHIARVVREAGHLPTTKRGRGASDMGVSAAANLLIGAHATDLPAKAGEAVETFRKLQPMPFPGRHGLNIEQSKWWSGLVHSATFGEALERLLAQSETDRKDAADIYYKYTGETTISYYEVLRVVRFSWPEPTASIGLTFVKIDGREKRPNADLNGAFIEMHFGLSEAERLFIKDTRPSGRVLQVTIRDSVIRRLSSACGAFATDVTDVEAAA